MVRKTHHGRPGYRVIPRDYGERHAPAANQLHTSECEIRGPDVLGTFNPVTGAYEVVPGPLRYVGHCKVKHELRSQIGLVAEESLPTQGYLVSIDKDANTVEVRDIVTITASVADPQMVGQEFSVQAVLKGDLRSERKLYCTDDLST